ncbi:hypothetical protein CNECB9_1790002 [Cupriavidus necator]|uniref:Uncharacterized protein n=1 Tax=Cupriavidus necator TaxID=106590 RepID=A0A1K0IB02_CUPNE|nr:hypothetical protein CNECB9_1790002 [Cupriavidus necator]
MDRMSMLSQVVRVNLSIQLSLKESLIGRQRIAEFTLGGRADILSPTMKEGYAQRYRRTLEQASSAIQTR